jgi:hypothetical protein
MIKECFGRFWEGECVECSVVELCSSYFVVEREKKCPLVGVGYDGTNEICRLCVEYFVGKECKRKSGKKRKVV